MLSMSCLFYRPQRSWGEVMFLHVSCDSVHRGVSQYRSQFTRWLRSDQMCFSVLSYTGVSTRHYTSMHCSWYPSMPCSRSPGGVSRPTAKGEVERSGQGGSPGSHPAPGGCLHQGGLLQGGSTPGEDPTMTATAGAQYAS